MSHYNPDQYTEPQAGLEPPVKEDDPTPEQQAVIDQVAGWIDTDVIAMVIAEELVDNDEQVTLLNCQKVWLDVLEDIHSVIASSIRALF